MNALKLYRLLPALLLMLIGLSCKKDLYRAETKTGDKQITLSSQLSGTGTLELSEANNEEVLVILNWTDPGYFTQADQGNVIVSYVLDLATAESFTDAKSYNLGVARTTDSLTGLLLNNRLLSIGCPAGTESTVYARVRSIFSRDTVVSNPVSFTVVPYAQPLPALLVMGYGGWTTPETRTNGYILTSANQDQHYEGYIHFSFESWGGANCRLLSTADNSAYGWGSDEYTLTRGDDIAALGNLWITPCPNYMKVNVDLDQLTISYTPIAFYVSGSFNDWGNTAMTFDDQTLQWRIENLTLSAGDTFGFTSSSWDRETDSWSDPTWDICYKVDEEDKLVFAGAPVWGGSNIEVPQSGDYTIILDLSAGDGSYSYQLKKN